MNGKFDIRPATQEDVANASALLRHVVQGLHYYNEIARETEIKKFDPGGLSAFVRDPSKVVLIARETGSSAMAGLIIGGEDDCLLWINWFIVAPEFRKSGVAYALIQQFEAEARRRGSHKIWCDCRTPNIPSIRLLTKYGFQIFGRATRHWYGQDFYLWERFLTD